MSFMLVTLLSQFLKVSILSLLTSNYYLRINRLHNLLISRNLKLNNLLLIFVRMIKS